MTKREHLDRAADHQARAHSAADQAHRQRQHRAARHHTSEARRIAEEHQAATTLAERLQPAADLRAPVIQRRGESYNDFLQRNANTAAKRRATRYGAEHRGDRR